MVRRTHLNGERQKIIVEVYLMKIFLKIFLKVGNKVTFVAECLP